MLSRSEGNGYKQVVNYNWGFIGRHSGDDGLQREMQYPISFIYLQWKMLLDLQRKRETGETISAHNAKFSKQMKLQRGCTSGCESDFLLHLLRLFWRKSDTAMERRKYKPVLCRRSPYLQHRHLTITGTNCRALLTLRMARNTLKGGLDAFRSLPAESTKMRMNGNRHPLLTHSRIIAILARKRSAQMTNSGSIRDTCITAEHETLEWTAVC